MERSDPDFEEQKNVEFIAEMNDIYQDVDNPDFVQITTTYKSRGHVPLAITSLMRLLIANNSDAADPIYNRAMDSQVERLVGCTGMCERVLRTPIPTCFTRHTSRLFFLWSNLIPFAVYSSLGPIATMPVSILASWSILAIGDVGVQLEEPFNVLPLRQYSEGIYDGTNSIEASYVLGSKTTAAATDVNN
jgi:predicted membrane chloride channel (bestrophin family)